MSSRFCFIFVVFYFAAVLIFTVFIRSSNNQIFYKLRLVVNSLGNLATCQQARIGGLPFTSSSTVNSDSSVVFGAATSLAINATESLAANICPNVTNIRLNLWDATGGVTDMTLAEVSAGAGFKISGVYNV